jgi:hypothetical protein
MTVQAPPGRPDHDELQALIEEARQRARQRRWRYAVAVGLVALFGVMLYVLVGGGTGRVAAPAAGSQLAVPPQFVRPGQFWYTRTTQSVQDSERAGGLVVRHGVYHAIGPSVRFDVRVVEESWVGVDGTMRYRVVAIPRFASPADGANWARYGRALSVVTANYDTDVITGGRGVFPSQLWYPWPWSQGVGTPANGPARVDVGDSLFSYRQLLALPIRAAALRGRLIAAEHALALRETRQGRILFQGPEVQAPAAVYNTLDAIAGLMASPLPATLRHALVRAAATLPATSVDHRARDSLGRRGVSVSASEPGSEDSQFTRRLVLDPATGSLLQGGGLDGGAAVAQGVVDSVYELPKGVSSVGAVGAPPAPQTLSISPAIGNPKTVFKVTLFARARRRSSPALDWSVAGTAPLRCFARGALLPLRASTTIRRAGGLEYVYRVRPPRARGNAWCPGRYELEVAPTDTRPLQPARSQWFYPLHNSIRYQRFSSPVGSRIFFQVR